MSRMLIFIGVALAIIAGVHYYLWARLVRDMQLPPPWGAIATAALAILAVGMPLSMILGRRNHAVERVLGWPAYVWMGLMFLLLVTLAGADAARLVAWMARHSQGPLPVDPERRTVIARLSASAMAQMRS